MRRGDRALLLGILGGLTPPSPSAADRRPLALVGRPRAVDRMAALLLRPGGDRRALAPLPGADPGVLAGCAAVIACEPTLEEARRAVRARRPTVVVVPRGGDRYAFGALPRLGATRAIPLREDGAPDVDAVLLALVDATGPDLAADLARRLPVLRPALDRGGAALVARRAAFLTLAAGRRRPVTGRILALELRLAAASARARGAGAAQHQADLALVAGASLALRTVAGQAARVAPRLGPAAVAYAGATAVARVVAARHGHAPAGARGPTR